jgi:hypothetical protein
VVESVPLAAEPVVVVALALSAMESSERWIAATLGDMSCTELNPTLNAPPAVAAAPLLLPPPPPPPPGGVEAMLERARGGAEPEPGVWAAAVDKGERKDKLGVPLSAPPTPVIDSRCSISSVTGDRPV